MAYQKRRTVHSVHMQRDWSEPVRSLTATTAVVAERMATSLGGYARGHAGGWDLPASVPTAGRHHLVAVWPA